MRLVVSDRNFNVKEILDNEFYDLSWAYAAIGGCGEFKFNLPRKRFAEKAISGDYNIKIYHRNPTTNVFDLWYQGLIENKIPNVQGLTEYIEFSGQGYQTQLSRIYINNDTQTSKEASVLIKYILDTYVVPYTNISYSISDLVATSFTFDSVTINDTALAAITKIAQVVGLTEWGVDRNRKFFFKPQSTSVGFTFLQGNNITNFQDNQDFTAIVNQIYVQGAQTGGTYFLDGPYNDTASQAKYGLRQQVIQNSSITTTTVSAQLAKATIALYKEVTRQATCEVVNYEGLLEGTTPVPLFQEISKKVKYGQRPYGTFLYSGIVNRQIVKISYALSNSNTLTINLELGEIQPKISKKIGRIQYKLDQLSSAAL